ncbi:response regulator receiver protein [Oleidesulfovibrio alaskensis G20]|uniref:Response regulator receiver protein n=1 Tax=Oleidesulfovibrio alaskensis (strain ATCC BAA-1058 / DSM 17464 / G20) TaxID=207559 RepID=Q317M4_OLEA2|nr:response regulator [Oleidesulfovibrio alaskensis]ABB36872.1 response regulator receiver protein [Oleidesulfovibrio alaskensis G20]MBG0774330.1 response regulator [Oleidesulfovibrio alaskensis]MBL3583507.1 response regulator [Oleidesulfovibrio alaskensis]
MPTILIVEDDPITRGILRDIVTSYGHKVLDVADGRTAWERLQNDPDIDLMITDVRMPGLDGMELVGMLRSNDRLQGLPVIITSGVVGLRQIARLLRRGASSFIAKPIDPKELQHCIQNTLAAGTGVPHSSRPDDVSARS